MRTTTFTLFDRLPDALREGPKRRVAEAAGVALLALVAGAGLSLMSWSVDDPSLTHATSIAPHNWLGRGGAIVADLLMQFLGVGAAAALAPPAACGWRLVAERRIGRVSPRVLLLMAGAAATCGFASLMPAPASWPLPSGLGGVVGDAVVWIPRKVFAGSRVEMIGVGLALAATAILSLTASAGYGFANAPPAGEPVSDKPRRRAPPMATASMAPRMNNACVSSCVVVTSASPSMRCGRCSASPRPAPCPAPATRPGARR